MVARATEIHGRQTQALVEALRGCVWEALQEVVGTNMGEVTREEVMKVVEGCPGDLGKYKGELYGLICGLMGGEANTVVRGVQERYKMGCGYTAAKLLAERFDVKTPALLLQMFVEVILSSCPGNHFRYNR